MEYRSLGQTGLKVSELCMGSMQFGWTADEATSHQILSESYEAGINFLDTADVYSRWAPGNPGGVAEAIIGKWIKASRIPRDKVVIATKVRGRMGDGPNDEGLSRAHILNAVDASLRRLDTDYIDLYQTHFYDCRHAHRRDFVRHDRPGSSRKSTLRRLFELPGLAAYASIMGIGPGQHGAL